VAGDPNRTGTGGRKKPKPKPRPKHPGHHHDHSRHRAPSWVKVGRHWNHHPGWIAGAVITVATATRGGAFDGLDIVSECSAIVADAFAAENLAVEEDGPELEPAVAAAYIAEGAICSVLIFIIGICAILLGISLILTAIAINVGPFRARIGAIFDPFAHLFEHFIHAVGDGIEQTISAPVILAAWFAAKLANAIGLVTAPSWHHFWRTRFVPLYHQVQWIRHQIRGINHVLFSGHNSILARLHHAEQSLGQLWGIVNGLPHTGGSINAAQLRAIEHRLEIHREQIAHINRVAAHQAQQIRTLEREAHSYNHRLTVEAHAVSQLQVHVRAIEHTLAGLSPANLNSIRQQIKQIEHELHSLGHFPLVHIESQITALQRGINWLDSLHPGRVAGEIAALERGLNWLESLHPGRIQHELDVITHRIDSLPKVNVHEIQTTLQRLQQEITQLQHLPHTGGGLTPQQKAQLHTAYHVSIGLAPLLALLPFGADFIRHIAKLRNCEPQCVGANIVPPDIIDALVADFVAKDGF